MNQLKDKVSAQLRSQPKMAQLCRNLIKLVARKKQEQKLPPQKAYGELIFLGNYTQASNELFLKENNIGLVISCLSAPIQRTFEGIDYMRIPIKDGPNQPLEEYMVGAYEAIEERVRKGKGVYIHCFAGRSRCVAVAISYIMIKQGVTYEEALGRLSYTEAHPNPYFIQILQKSTVIAQKAAEVKRNHPFINRETISNERIGTTFNVEAETPLLELQQTISFSSQLDQTQHSVLSLQNASLLDLNISKGKGQEIELLFPNKCQFIEQNKMLDEMNERMM